MRIHGLITKRRITTSTLLTGLFLFFSSVVAQTNMIAPAEQMVNPKLAKRMELYKPSLQKVGDRVHAVIGYDYSNYAYIEGKDGIIVIDTGWFPGQAKRSMADYRQQITDKPIAAIIYTHSHIDHNGAVSAIMEGQQPEIPVYGPKGWERWIDESFSHLGRAMFRRIFMQMGLVLPHGDEGTVGNGINPSPKIEGRAELTFPPTIDVEEPIDVTIAGVPIQIIPQQGDIPENLYIWLPDDEILFVGDIPLHATFPAIETVRFEAARDPRAHIDSLNKVLELNPEFVVPGHGRVLKGREDVRDVTLANRDTVEFMIDQVDRLYVNGYSADQIVDRLELPPTLAAHPDLQPFYHRVEWMIKTMYFKRAGFVGETMDYLTLTQSEESKRLIPLLGGVDAVREQAQDALSADDPRWAARLATYVLEVDANDQHAKEIRQAAFTRIARTTESANERNYLLSSIREENGELDWKEIFSKSDLASMGKQSTSTILAMMKSRFRAEDANGVETLVKVQVEDQMPRYMQVRNNVLLISDTANESVQGAMSLSRETLNRIAANMTNWSDALATDEISVDAGRPAIKQLLSLIE